MSELTPNRDVPQGEPRGRVLDYHGPGDGPRRFPDVLLLSAAVLFAGGAVVISVFLAVTVSVLLGHAVWGVLVLLLTAALLAGLGYYGHSAPARRPFAMGIWIGTGVGLCSLGVIFIQRAYWR